MLPGAPNLSAMSFPYKGTRCRAAYTTGGPTMSSLPSRTGQGRARIIGGVAAATILGFAVAAPSYGAAPPETFADLAAKVSPAVVNVSSTHVMTQQDGQSSEGMP